MEKVDAEIDALKSREIEAFTTPCSIFMSFECEEGVNRALRFDDITNADPQLAHLRTWLG